MMATERVTDEDVRQWFAELDTLIADIGRKTPPGITVADVIADIRRDFGPAKERHSMAKIGVKEFKARASEIFRRVRDEGEAVEVTYRGEVVAHVVPAKKKIDRRRIEEVLVERDKLIAELSGGWPQEVSAADAVAEDRRDR